MPASATGWVLVIDDDPDVRDMLRTVLSCEGYAVQTASSGADALAQLAAAMRPPALILLDLHMPGISGQEVMAYVRANEWVAPAPPVVFMSAGAQVHAEAAHWHVAGSLAKPFALSELLAVVTGFCRQSSAESNAGGGGGQEPGTIR